LKLIGFEVLQAQTHLHQKCERDEKPQESLKEIYPIFKNNQVSMKSKIEKKEVKGKRKHTSVNISSP
jgi:hypothetical protein